MEKHIALLRGDGIGPEIVDSAVKVLEAVAEKFGHTFTFTRYLIGGAVGKARAADEYPILTHRKRTHDFVSGQTLAQHGKAVSLQHRRNFRKRLPV